MVFASIDILDRWCDSIQKINKFKKIINLKMFLKKLSFVLIVLLTSSNLVANEKTDTGSQLNFYTGNFDFSDDKQKALLVGFQHQDENLSRDTFLGNVSPITGGFVTENSAAYIYTGIEWNVDMGGMIFTPSFAPGLYHEGDGKDLGHVLEFKSEVQLSYESSDSTSFGVSYLSLIHI